VSNVRVGVSRRRTREFVASALGSVLLLLAVSVPVLAALPPGPTQLQDPDVTPRTGSSTTPITFTVTYWNAHALPPDYVRVVVGGATHAMSGSGTDWRAGVVFKVTTLVPAGTHAVRFEARDAERFVDQVDGGSVVIGQAPTPTPKPPPAPEPTPTGGGSGGSGGSDGGSGSTGGGSTGSTDPTSGTGGSAGGAVIPNSSGSPDDRDAADGSTDSPATGSGGPTDGTGSPSGSGGMDRGPRPGFSGVATGVGSTGGGGSTGSGASTPGAGGSGASDGSTSTNGGTPGEPDGSQSETGGTSPSSGGPLALLAWLRDSVGGNLAAVGLTGTGHIPTLPATVAPTILVTTWMAFVLFNRRRRDGEPPASEDVLHAAAATGLGIAAVMVPSPVAPMDPEAMMPRWRRPSLLEARKTDPIRAPAPERPRLTFAQGLVESSAGAERRPIRYAVIPLLDRPDEILATRIGELVAGDEVQVQARTGSYCHVLCPDGRQGWVHRTTLGDVIVAPRFAGGRGAEIDEPEAENALAALLEARGLR
jgi:hypothetical protein